MQPVTISWTQLRSRYERRGRKQSAAGISPSMVKAFYAGNVADRMMRAWLRDPSRTNTTTLVDEAMESAAIAHQHEGRPVRWQSAAEQQRVRERCLLLANRLIPILTELVLPHSWQAPLSFRAPVTIPVGGADTEITLVGELDLLMTTRQGDHYIYDLKMTENNTYWRSTCGQLVFYDIAMSLILGKSSKATGLIQPLCSPPILEFSIGTQERREMWSHIIKIVEITI